MKTSTRIALAAIVVWVPFTMMGNKADLFHLNHTDERQLLISGIVVVVLLKFILGALVDKKKI